MHKIIAITGGEGSAQKTILVQTLSRILTNAISIKIGPESKTSIRNQLVFPSETSIEHIKQQAGYAQYLVFENGDFFENSSVKPMLEIYLPSPTDDAVSLAQKKASGQLVKGLPLTEMEAVRLWRQLGITRQKWEKFYYALSTCGL